MLLAHLACNDKMCHVHSLDPLKHTIHLPDPFCVTPYGPHNLALISSNNGSLSQAVTTANVHLPLMSSSGIQLRTI